jgi:hypothetical protein
MPHSIKSLPSWGTAAGEHLLRVAAGSRGTASGPVAMPRGGKAFKKIIFKTLLTFFKKQQNDKCKQNHKIIS